MKKIILSLFAALTLLGTLGCNTVQGIGKDIEKGGEAIQRSAQ